MIAPNRLALALAWMMLVGSGCATTTDQTVASARKNAPPIDWTPLKPTVRKFAPLGPTEMRVHFIDVGQGDATLLEFPCAAVLIDTGGEHNQLFASNPALNDYLAGFFSRRKDLKDTLALLVLTHPHIDHTRGVRTVVDNYLVRNVLTNGMENPTIGGPEQTYVHTYARDSGGATKHRAISLADIPTAKDGTSTGLTGPIIDPVACKAVDPVITALWGRVPRNPGWGSREYTNANNHSVALRISFGTASLLFTGDLETEALHHFVARYKASGLLDVGVYKAGHHGSYNGTTEDLVKAMSPKVAVFSMGPSWRKSKWSAWRYGHPRLRAVKMLQEGVSQNREPRDVKVGTRMRTFETWSMRKALYGTGWEGTVVFKATSTGEIRPDAPVPQGKSVSRARTSLQAAGIRAVQPTR